MPRRRRNTDKPPLHFLERPVGGAKVQRHDPEVRAALKPREFFAESQTESTSVLNSWVSPQFDGSEAAAAAPGRRGRRKVRAAVSVLDNSTQLCRKTSAFRSLTFTTRTTASAAENQPRALRRHEKTSNAPRRASETPALGSTSDPTPAQGSTSDPTPALGSTSDSTPALGSTSDPTPAQGSTSDPTPALGSTSDPTPAQGSTSDPTPAQGSTSDSTPTLAQVEDESICSSPHPLLYPPCTPPCAQPPDALALDTPERDYGVKVTWRRRKELMLLLKERGFLSESDALIHS